MKSKLFLGFGILIVLIFLRSNTKTEGLLASKNDYSHSTNGTELNHKKSNFQDLGQEIYSDFCIQCHGADGKGDNKNFPPLASSDWLSKNRLQSIYAVKYGLNGAIVVNKKKYNSAMPAQGLTNSEVAAVMNYIMNSWGNQQKNKVTEQEVEAIQYKK